MPYIGKSPHFGVRNRFIYTATGDETSKSGADDNGATLTFTDGAYVDVYLNGVLLKPDTDYVTTTANTIGSLSALSTSDILEVIVYDVFSVSDTVSAASGGTFQGAVGFNGGVSTALTPSSADGVALGSASLEWSDLYLADGGVIYFGNDQEITLTHSADDGLILKHVGTGDGKEPSLTFQAGDNDIAVNDVLGSIFFQAPDEGAGTDAILVSAAIEAVSEGDFSASSNVTSLVFKTGASEAAAEKMRIMSDGDTGIGTSAPAKPLHVKGGSDNGKVRVEHGSNSAYCDYAYDGPSASGNVFISAAGDTAAYIYTNGSQRLKVDSGSTDVAGMLRVNTTASGSQAYIKSDGTDEHTLYLEGDNIDDAHVLQCYSNSAHSGNCARLYQDGPGSDANTLFVHTDASITPVYINRGGNDGALIDLRQGGTQEGTISVSGSTISYNAFSGSHWSRLADNSKPTILRGTVMETLDEMCVWHHLKYTIPAVLWKEGDKDISEGKKVGDERYGEQVIKEPYAKPDNKNVGDKIDYDHKGTTYEATIEKVGDVKHVMCKISDTADCTNVYGVFLDWDNDDDSVNDMYVSAVGTNLVRIHKDQTVSKGDLLTSNGDGTAKKQDDDIIRSKTIGKVLSNVKQETYSDGSYTVPCALYCG